LDNARLYAGQLALLTMISFFDHKITITEELCFLIASSDTTPESINYLRLRGK